jgi:predicted membrane-bound mannosyltransferase
MPSPGNKDFTFYIFLAAIVFFGAYLRLYSLPQQVLLDDEWHGISFVIGKSYLEILRNYNPSDYSSPILNIWRLFLYDFWHWSELSLRVPVLLAGLFALILIPVLIRKNFGKRTGIIFALLAAVSPQMVFYSRYCRGYSLSLFFGFCALFLFNNFVKKGRAKDAVLFIIFSSLSV